MFEYFTPKKKFKKKDFEFMYLFFDNGDYFSLHGCEIAEIQLKLYDRLVWGEGGFCPVAESGYIKLRVRKKNKALYDGMFLYNAEEYIKDRKSYIENRCVKEGGIKCVRLFDENHWHNTIYGDIVAATDGEFLLLNFLSRPNSGQCNSDKNIIYLNDVSLPMIESINLDFENCENFTIYKNEISDIQLQFENELVHGSGDLVRCVKGGFIKFKFDKEIDFREARFLGCLKSQTLKEFKKRLCPKGDISTHDICHLYINYDYAGFGSRRTECIEIGDIRPDEELERIEGLEEEGDYRFEDFVGGYCKKCSDGTIIISFGKSAEKPVNV